MLPSRALCRFGGSPFFRCFYDRLKLGLHDARGDALCFLWHACIFVGLSGYCDAEDVLLLRGGLHHFALVQKILGRTGAAVAAAGISERGNRGSSSFGGFEIRFSQKIDLARRRLTRAQSSVQATTNFVVQVFREDDFDKV